MGRANKKTVRALSLRALRSPGRRVPARRLSGNTVRAALMRPRKGGVPWSDFFSVSIEVGAGFVHRGSIAR